MVTYGNILSVGKSVHNALIVAYVALNLYSYRFLYGICFGFELGVASAARNFKCSRLAVFRPDAAVSRKVFAYRYARLCEYCVCIFDYERNIIAVLCVRCKYAKTYFARREIRYGLRGVYLAVDKRVNHAALSGKRKLQTRAVILFKQLATHIVGVIATGTEIPTVVDTVSSPPPAAANPLRFISFKTQTHVLLLSAEAHYQALLAVAAF